MEPRKEMRITARNSLTDTMSDGLPYLILRGTPGTALAFDRTPSGVAVSVRWDAALIGSEVRQISTQCSYFDLDFLDVKQYGVN